MFCNPLLEPRKYILNDSPLPNNVEPILNMTSGNPPQNVFLGKILQGPNFKYFVNPNTELKTDVEKARKNNISYISGYGYVDIEEHQNINKMCA